jgi:biopolymer transport protein ExbD
MRLPRNVKMLRGPVDPSALAGTLFLLWTASLVHSSLVLPPGLRVRLPEAEGQWGEVLPGLSVAVDGAGRILFEHQIIAESNLHARLRQRAAQRGTNQVLLLLVDRGVTIDTWTRLINLAQTAGIREVVLATSPRPGGPTSRPETSGHDP